MAQTKKTKTKKPGVSKVVINASFDELVKMSVEGNPKPESKKKKKRKRLINE